MKLYTKRPLNPSSKLIDGLYETLYSESYFCWPKLLFTGDLEYYFGNLTPEVKIDASEKPRYEPYSLTIFLDCDDERTFVHELQHALQHFDDRLDQNLRIEPVLRDLLLLYKDQVPLEHLREVSYYLYFHSFGETEARRAANQNSTCTINFKRGPDD